MSTTDNPLRDPNRGWKIWQDKEIYVPGGEGRYVPNVDDLIWSKNNGWYTVTSVDYTSGVSQWIPWYPPRQNEFVGLEDILLGSGPGRASESYRAYLDTSVVPFTLSFDSRLKLYGTTNRYMKVFLGTDTNENTGKVISAYYDQSGNHLGENIPLEVVGMENINNYAIQTPVVGYTMTRMNDGEVVTAVIYDDAGVVRSENYVTIKNSSFIRSVDQSLEYITGISLDSPYLSPSDPSTLEVPINMVVANIPMRGVVTYNSGRTVNYNLDGGKMALLGIENYIATRLGKTVPVSLRYKMGSNEYSYDMTASVNGHISVRYNVRTADPVNAYSVKLYAYPEWVDAVYGYRLRFFLTNLERQNIWEVTPHVEAGSGTRAFNPTEYGTLQRVTFMVDLSKVDSLFTHSYHHTESFEFFLLGPPNTQDDTSWEIGFEPNQDPRYGIDTVAKIGFVASNNWSVDLTSGCTTLEQWLEKVYYLTDPLYNTRTEDRAITPTHFYLRVGNHRELFPISQWGTILTMHEGLETGKCVYLEFIRRTSNNDLQLSVTGMAVHRV